MLKLARYLRRFVDNFDERLEDAFLGFYAKMSQPNIGDYYNEENIKETHLDHDRSA
jgi:hypothetical protein